MTEAGATGVIVKPVDVRLAELWSLSGIHRMLAKCLDVCGSVGFMRQLWGSRIAPRSMLASNGYLGAPHPSALAKDDPLQTMLISILERIGIVLGAGHHPKIFKAIGAPARVPAKYRSISLSFMTIGRDAENLAALTTSSIKHAYVSAMSATLAVA